MGALRVLRVPSLCALRVLRTVCTFSACFFFFFFWGAVSASRYLCIARGFVEGSSGTINRPLSISRFEDRTRTGKGDKKPARTRWTKLAQAEIALIKSPNPKCNTIYDSARLSVLLMEPLSGANAHACPWRVCVAWCAARAARAALCTHRLWFWFCCWLHLLVCLWSGRFHQIRRHLGHPSVSHPVVGDTQHGDPRLNRSLAFTLNQIHEQRGQPASTEGSEQNAPPAPARDSFTSNTVVENEDGGSAQLQVDAPPTKVLRANDGEVKGSAVPKEGSLAEGGGGGAAAGKSGPVAFSIGGEHVALAQEAELPEIRQQLHAYSFEFVHPMVGRAPCGKLVPIVSQWVGGTDGQQRGTGRLVSESSEEAGGGDGSGGGPLEPVRVKIVAPLQPDMETLLRDVGIDPTSLDFQPRETAEQAE